MLRYPNKLSELEELNRPQDPHLLCDFLIEKGVITLEEIPVLLEDI